MCFSFNLHMIIVWCTTSLLKPWFQALSLPSFQFNLAKPSSWLSHYLRFKLRTQPVVAWEWLWTIDWSESCCCRLLLSAADCSCWKAWGCRCRHTPHWRVTFKFYCWRIRTRFSPPYYVHSKSIHQYNYRNGMWFWLASQFRFCNAIIQRWLVFVCHIKVIGAQESPDSTGTIL